MNAFIDFAANVMNSSRLLFLLCTDCTRAVTSTCCVSFSFAQCKYLHLFSDLSHMLAPRFTTYTTTLI